MSSSISDQIEVTQENKLLVKLNQGIRLMRAIKTAGGGWRQGRCVTMEQDDELVRCQFENRGNRDSNSGNKSEHRRKNRCGDGTTDAVDVLTTILIRN